MNRRSFVLGAGAFALAAGCKSAGWMGLGPDLRFGVISDIHVTTPESCALLEQSFRYFRERGVDAVVIPGDLTDWGLRSSLVLLKQTWIRVFADTGVIPLFCTGNHDFEGWSYGDMALDMRVHGRSEDEALAKIGMAECWQGIFGEPYSPVRRTTVKGYDFVSSEYKGYEHLGEFMNREGARLKGGKPFFYFQHLPIRGTTVDSFGWADDGSVVRVLERFPNCIAFTGHTHRPFADERSVWQGAFTVVDVPSLSCASLPSEEPHENGVGNRRGKSKQTMPIIPYRRDLRGGQGYVVNVWQDRVVVERIDLEELASDMPDWVIPLGVKEKPYSYAVRENMLSVPRFPGDAKVQLTTRNTENRAGHWVIAMDCRFPSAEMPDGTRVFDYEIKVVPKDGSAPLVRRFFSPAYAKMAKDEPAEQRFWFDVSDLPPSTGYTIAICARNCFGRRSASLVADWSDRR